MKKLNIWIEITTLLIPGYNDSKEELIKIAEFISSLGKEIPWHISRYHPDYKFNKVVTMDTPVSSLKTAKEIGENAGLKYVYIGNILKEGENTHCYNCKKKIIERVGFSIVENNVYNSKCGFCNTSIDGIFN